MAKRKANGIPQPILRDWNNNPIPVSQPTKPEGNPCIALYGPGPDGATCKDCTQFVGICKARTYYKCQLRTNTSGPATDHKRSWPACAKFEKREDGKAIPLYDGR